MRWILLAALACCAAKAADSEACAACHRAIYETYRQTAMARSSGAVDRSAPAEFTQASFTAWGFRYRVAPYSLEFEKVGDPAVHAKRALGWFVGSGAVARSYLIAADGFLFEAPVTYYSNERRWDLSPSYGRYAYPYLTRPVAPACLTCHASALTAIAGTLNRFGDPPFREGGVACERCHGPGEEHIRRMRSGGARDGAAIVNPAKLTPDRRDSVCAQCHLQGDVRVTRRGASWESYRPGGRLADSVAVFVRADALPGMRVTSHFEKLAQSACKRASHDRLWCGSCHDPHAAPAAAERAAWYRAKCRNCHPAEACSETSANRARQQNDCVACHMPRSPVVDAEHVVYTDHSIPRRPVAASPPPAKVELALWGGGTASTRDLALAYAIVAGRPGSSAGAAARRLLEAAEKESPDDSEVAVSLAEIYRNAGEPDRAIPLYRRAIELDPAQVTAPAGLGAILFERGQDREAIRLWQGALARNSGLVMVATNLAMAQWRAGERSASLATLRNVIDLSPAFQPARDLLQKLQSALQ